MTIKLYDTDSHATGFEATVISCESCGELYKTELDQTLFFPEEGGQCADKGTIDNVEITHVELSGDTVFHYSKTPFEPGKKVEGKIDFATRFRNMQNHSGEHIICGIAHKLYGYENVGFHLGEDIVTMDLSGELTKEDIQKIEILANEAVAKNMPVTAFYPSKEELETMEYRSKGEIEGDVRIVTIGDADACACCAPHVNFTGEIGLIKILNFERHRGGMRLTIACGLDALKDYCMKHDINAHISALLSVKQNETDKGVEKMIEDMNTLRGKLSEKTKQICNFLVDSIESTDKNVCLFCDDVDADSLRLIANRMKEKTSAFAAVLTGDDENGYRYVIVTSDGDVSGFVKEANAALSGRGGGRGEMASGTFSAKRAEIESYFI